jgi:hypothetical protein
MTRLPDSSSCATAGAELVVLEDHAVWPEPSRRQRLPVLPTISTPAPPEVLLRGVSRLATQQTASGDAVNQMPRYLLAGTPDGEKKPRVKELPDDTNVSPSVMLPPLLSVSDAMPAAESLRKTKSTRKIMAETRSRNLLVFFILIEKSVGW